MNDDLFHKYVVCKIRAYLTEKSGVRVHLSFNTMHTGQYNLYRKKT